MYLKTKTFLSAFWMKRIVSYSDQKAPESLKI